MAQNQERSMTQKEKLIRSVLMGAMVMFPYTLAFLVFLFLSAKVLISRYWLGLLISAAATFGVWVLVGLLKRRIPR